MAFSTLIFLFAFLPASLLLYHLVPKALKNPVLLVCSLVFYAWGTPEYLAILLFSVVFNYCAGLFLAGGIRESGRRGGVIRPTAGLLFAVGVNVALLCLFKYWAGLCGLINTLLGTSLSPRALPLPIGLSFYTFSVLSYLFDVYRGKTEAQKNPLKFALFVTFFPKVVSGPIVQYADFEAELSASRRSMTFADLGEGAALFIVGLGKKLLLADGLSTSFYAMQALPGDQISVATAWLGSLFYSLVLYFDFSGYSDMAIGLGKMLGFRMEKNFDHPYISLSVTEFWRRWHISLGRWFRDYVYFPLGGSRVSGGRAVLNLLIVWLLTGIWHGSTLGFLLWGLIHGFAQLMEKYPLKNALDKTPRILRWLGTMLLVNMAWVFFSAPTVGDACLWVGRMVGIGAASLGDATAKYYLTTNLPLLLTALLGATPLPRTLAMNVAVGPGLLRKVMAVVFFAGVLALSVAAMMNATYSTFLYFQF